MPADPRYAGRIVSETAPRFAGIGGHHSHRAGTVEWLTPPAIIAALGLFDLDPCAPIDQPYPTAARTMTIIDDGLFLPWRNAAGRKERVWLNPPYASGQIERWLEKMALHDFGTALIFARTETDAFFRYVWESASALLFMRGRINFHVGEAFSVLKTRKTFRAGDEAEGNAGAPTVLCAYGAQDADILAACQIDGHFVPLRFPRSVLVSIFSTSEAGENFDMTWREVLAEFFAEREGPVELADLYRYVRSHPKSAGNNHPEAKARQILQRGPYRPARRGAWERIVD